MSGEKYCAEKPDLTLCYIANCYIIGLQNDINLISWHVLIDFMFQTFENKRTVEKNTVNSDSLALGVRDWTHCAQDRQAWKDLLGQALTKFWL
jgi:hypothetical protein